MKRLRTVSRVALIANASICLGSVAAMTAVLRGHVPEERLHFASLAAVFGMLNVITAFLATSLHAFERQGRRRALVLLALCCTTALAMELAGTTTGIPFGHYEYSDFLGPKFAGRVPYVMPLTWFSLLYPALLLAERLRPPRLLLPLVAALVLTLADVPMDPAMTSFYACWTWKDLGAHLLGTYYQMPLSNWAGWILTGALVVELFRRIARARPAVESIAVPSLLYLTQCLFFAALDLVYGRPGATLGWLCGALVLGGALLLRNRSNTRASMRDMSIVHEISRG